MGVGRGAYTCVLCCVLVCFRSILNALLCSSVAYSAVCHVQGLSTQSEWTTGPVLPPDQLGSKARLMAVVNLASEEWSCPHWTGLLCDWVGCACACVCLRLFVNVSRGLNDDKQMPAVGASTHNLAPVPPEITTQHLCATLQAHTWLYCGGVGERENEFLWIPPFLTS